jgi:hypothetical protein
MYHPSSLSNGVMSKRHHWGRKGHTWLVWMDCVLLVEKERNCPHSVSIQNQPLQIYPQVSEKNALTFMLIYVERAETLTEDTRWLRTGARLQAISTSCSVADWDDISATMGSLSQTPAKKSFGISGSSRTTCSCSLDVLEYSSLGKGRALSLACSDAI